MPPPAVKSPAVQMSHPTVATNSSSVPPPRPAGSSSSSSRPTHHGTAPREGRRSDLLCRVKWNNSLPDIPFDPKFIMYPFDQDRFKKYKPTSLEKEYKHDLLTEHDLGVSIDLVSPETYAVPAEVIGLSPEDEKLMEEDSGISGDGGIKLNNLNEKRSRQHNLVVPWLKKTEYISNEFNRYGASSENNETKVGYYVQKKFKEDKEKMICLDKDAQIAAINKTFEEAKKPIRQHFSKKGVFPVEVCPLLPDFDFWKIPFAQVSFDAEPIATTGGRATKEQDKLMCEAMIRGILDQESGEQFVAYFLPTNETLQKRHEDSENGQDYDPDQEYVYQQTREYTWSVKNKSNRGYDQNYFFVKRGREFYYNELETKVKLTKRRTKTGSSGSAKLIVRHRSLNDQELKIQTIRETALKPQEEERNPEENDDDEENDEKESGDENGKEEKGKSSGESEGEKSPAKEKPAARIREKRKRSADSASASDASSSSSSGSASSASSSSSDSDSEAESKKQKTKSKPVYSSDSE